MIAILFFILGLFTLCFAFIFIIAPLRVTNRNILPQEIDIFGKAKRKNEITIAEEEINQILNKVYSIDEKLASFKMAVSILLFLAGILMIGAGIFLAVKVTL
ncbi:MAG: hypothetical protein JW844_00130 [Candidatus Omnitrophica bacterium]|nr:hypothetical protein [Candidatus Omnitrophota bacterium]